MHAKLRPNEYLKCNTFHKNIVNVSCTLKLVALATLTTD